MMDTLIAGDVTYLPLFDCFAKVKESVVLLDNSKGYKVENKHEGITNMLVRPHETYGKIRW